MTKPILDCPGVVAGVRQRVSAAVPQHVGMDQEVEAGALPNALDQAVDRIGRKWSVLLGLKHEARVGKFPPQLSQCSELIPPERMHRRFPVLQAPHMERS